MSYYNDNAACLVSHSFEDRRAPSNSLYMPRNNDFEDSNNFSNCFQSPNNFDSNRASSPRPSPINESNIISLKKNEECESSVPGSTDVDSEEDDFESHFDAIDELSELFESTPVSEEQPKRCMQFARPSNPVIKNSQFCLPRSSAPAPEFSGDRMSNLEVSEMNFSSSFGSIKRELNMNFYNMPSGSLVRPVARR